MTQLPLHDTETRHNIGLMTKHGTEYKIRRGRRAETGIQFPSLASLKAELRV